MTEDLPTPPPDAGTPQSTQPYGSLHPTAPPHRSGRSAGFWIAIIGGSFALILVVALILMALAVPQMLKIKKVANQTSAIQTMRAISMAEMSYNSVYPGNGFACSLQVLGGDKSGAPSPQSSQLLDPALTDTGQKNGYIFAITGCTKATVNDQDAFTSYHLTAVPESIGKTGDKGYCADENNVIKVDPTGGTNCTLPAE